jgi:hypothetical protein
VRACAASGAGGPARLEHRRLLDTFVAAAQTGDLASLERLLAEDRSPEPLAA